MKRLVALSMLAAAVGGQGGRDGAKGVLFVAWDASVESDAIHRIAWRALEPHDVNRRRMATFGGDKHRARDYLRANKDAKVVVAYDPRVASLAESELPQANILKIYEEHGAHVHAWTDRDRFFDAAALLPGVSRQAIADTSQAIGGLKWIREGAGAMTPGKGHVLSTSAHVPEGRAVLTMRPHPRSLGLHVAAQVLAHLRTGKPFSRVTVRRMRLTVDLAAARRANITVPLKLLARADVVRPSR